MDIEHYNRLRNAWVKKYGTFRNFDRWYGMNREIATLSAPPSLWRETITAINEYNRKLSR